MVQRALERWCVMGRPREHDDKIGDIMRLVSLGYTERQIALELGLGKSSVNRLKKGKHKCPMKI